MISEHQYHTLMKAFQSSGRVGSAALKSVMHRKTASRYLKRGLSPKQQKLRRPPRPRTVPDPLAALWPLALPFLERTPSIQAKGLFLHLLEQHPELAASCGKAMRTFQRKVKAWRLAYGPEQEVHFQQRHRPAEVMQFDWTRTKELQITLAGQPFEHLLAHSVLPYSNWEWAVPCLSESGLSLKSGVQAGCWALGGVTKILQTDQSGTATHQLKRNAKKRGLNRGYLALCAHLRVEPRTIHIHSPDENGDVESLQGHLKKRIELALQLRSSRDFKDVTDYAVFVAAVCTKANKLPDRTARVAEERLLLQPLPPMRFPDYIQETGVVSKYATVRIKNDQYTVPARLIGATVQIQCDEWKVRVFHNHRLVVEHDRACGHQPRIDYRHIIAGLVKKPGAFARLTYREQLFPTVVFRQAHVRLQALDERQADKRYLQLLLLAAQVGEAKVEAAIASLLRDDAPPLPERVRALVEDPPPPSVFNAIKPFTPDLASYDRLLEASA
jgi:transposase